MKKVLILTYYFPPCNLPGANRPFGWAKYLYKFGYYPVIITRRWDNEIKTPVDILKKTGREIIYEKNDEYEVYYLPYKQNLRDKLYVKYGENKFVFIRKFLTFFELFLQNFTSSAVSFNNIYKFSHKYLSENKDVKLIIATGAPFILFKFAYQLNKQFNVSWIADYRDDWNTTEFSFYQTKYYFLFSKIEKRSEIKWVGSSMAITSISNYYVKKISKYVNKAGHSIYNGFFEGDEIENKEKSNIFNITFVGTLYATQRIEFFLEAFKKIVQTYSNKLNIMLNFPGLAYDKREKNRIVEFLGTELLNFTQITNRISRKEIKEFENNTDIFLYCAHKGIKGVLGSKIFEYIKLRKPVIICPSDGNELENVLTSVGIGNPCNSVDESYNILKSLIDIFLLNKKIPCNINEERRDFYSREHQTKLLAEIFDKILDAPIKPKIETTTTFRDTSFKVMYNLKFHKVINPSIFNKATIVCFHNISDEPNRAYPPLKIKEFEKLIYYIYNNYQVVTLSNINKVQKNSKSKIVLTFDDGYKDFVKNALPVLQRFEMPAVQSIVTDCVESGLPIWTQQFNAIVNYIYYNKKTINYSHNKHIFKYDSKHSLEQFSSKFLNYLLKINSRERNIILSDIKNQFSDYQPILTNMMTWEDLKLCMKSGVDIASHSLSHDSLTGINSNEAIEMEIAKSKQIIEEKLNTTVNIFTFPNGLYNEQTVDLCKKYGYKYLFTTREKILNPQTILENEYPILIPRISVNKSTFEKNVFKIHNFHNLFRWHKE